VSVRVLDRDVMILVCVRVGTGAHEKLLALLSARHVQPGRRYSWTSRLVEVEELTAANARPAGRVAELVARLNQSSRNSSCPLSSDGPEAPLRPSRRGSYGKRPGKQPGAIRAIIYQPSKTAPNTITIVYAGQRPPWVTARRLIQA
jgi:hypothetical protein